MKTPELEAALTVKEALPDKLKNMMLAHLDGVYVFSARENCDELVTQLIHHTQQLVDYHSRSEDEAAEVMANAVIGEWTYFPATKDEWKACLLTAYRALQPKQGETQEGDL